MTIREIALLKKKEYNDKYLAMCKETGGIMNGYSSMSIGADLASFCDTKHELLTLRDIYYRKAKSMNEEGGVHGFNFVTSAFTEILNYEDEKK